jgi:multicomponent Na+:H+ antiporter subunit A
MLTVAYGIRFLWGAFATKPDVDPEGTLIGPRWRPPGAFLAPPHCSSFLSILGGLSR